MEYITFMHRNTESEATAGEWNDFLSEARASGIFRGGSAIGTRFYVGVEGAPDTTSVINGFMRFETADIKRLTDLLRKHPTVVHGGTIEICELPVS